MITLLITLVVLGLLFWLVSLLPLAEPFPMIIRVVAIVVAIIVVLNFFSGYLGFDSTLLN